MNLIAYSDGAHSPLDIGELIGVPVSRLTPIWQQLRDHGLLHDLGEPGAPPR